MKTGALHLRFRSSIPLKQGKSASAFACLVILSRYSGHAPVTTFHHCVMPNLSGDWKRLVGCFAIPCGLDIPVAELQKR